MCVCAACKVVEREKKGGKRVHGGEETWFI
jgi:hypothetical protein